MALTGPAHAHLSDAELLEHAVAQAARFGMKIESHDVFIGVALAATHYEQLGTTDEVASNVIALTPPALRTLRRRS
jgi:hypothetical protein